MAPSGGWRNGWRAQMFQNPPSYKHLPVFFVAVPLVWVDWDVPGGNPELSEVKWSDVWPSMVTHTRNLCSAFNPSKCTHTAVNTHTLWTHTQSSGQPYCCSARGAVGGSVPCSRVSPQSWYWGWRERWLFTPPTYNSCQTWDSNPRPSGCKSDSIH